MTYSQDLFIISPAKESLLLKYYEQAGAILERLKQTKTAEDLLRDRSILSKQELLGSNYSSTNADSIDPLPVQFII